MAKNIITELPKAKLWGYVALGASVVGAIMVGMAINESMKARRAEAKKNEAEADKEVADEIVEEITASASGRGSERGIHTLQKLASDHKDIWGVKSGVEGSTVYGAGYCVCEGCTSSGHNITEGTCAQSCAEHYSDCWEGKGSSTTPTIKSRLNKRNWLK